MKGFLIVFTAASLFLMQFTASGQNPDGNIRIKIDANVDGNQVNIDTSINALEDFNIDAFLKSLGIENELNQLNIDINTGFRFNWDETDLQNMLGDLRDMELPEMPEMPEINLEGLKDLQFTTPNKAVLGVYTEKNAEGAVISGLVRDGSAAASGLLEGDIITGIDNRTIESPANLSEVIGMYEPGATVKVTFIRNGIVQSANISLKENTNTLQNWMPEVNFDNLDTFNFNKNLFEFNQPSRGFLGVYLDDENGRVLITGLEKDGPAEKGGIQEGDIILEMNGENVKNYDELMEIMNGTSPGEKIKVTIERNGKTEKKEIILGEVKSKMLYFNNNEEGNAPNIIFNHVAPVTPGCAYSYNSTDGKRNVTISITAVKNDDKEEIKNGTEQSLDHPLMDTQNLSVYSNPSDGTFNIRFELINEGDTKIAVTDINGAVLYDETIKNFSGVYNKTITLTDAPKGTYFVKVSQNGYAGTKTVILQ